MRELHLIPGYLHVSAGNYTDAMFPHAAPLCTCTGILTDGDIDDGVVIVGAMLVNFGFAIGFSWTGVLG